MTHSRRAFLGSLGAAFAARPALADTRERPDLVRMIFNDDPVEPAPLRPDPRTWRDDTITAAWIGHSTILLNFFGSWILTDPVFSERIGLSFAGLFTLGPKRLVQPALNIEDLPPLDVILLSHAHMDHLDLPTLGCLAPETPVVMAKNTSDVIGWLDVQTVYELDWGKWTRIGDLRIEALEVRHFGWRYPWEEDRSRGFADGRSYNAYLLSKGERHIVFGGDTSYHELFRPIGARGLRIDLAMMPIGAYDPWIRNHANPEQALAMADHLGARCILPMHWNTFIQSSEPRREPLERLRAALASAPERLALQTIGETWTAGGLPPSSAATP
jgi:L-ascorbate metabolism protein UlaG (beta-lactamase superfamily)